MKNIFLTSLCLLFVVLAMVSCDNTASDQGPTLGEDAKSRFSYSYGALVAKGIERMALSPEEKNADKFIEGVQVGLKGEAKDFDDAQKMIQMRMQAQQPSASPEDAAKIAYSVGVSVSGGLPQKVEIPSDKFDFDMIKMGFNAGVNGDSLLINEVLMDSLVQAFFKPYTDEYQAVQQAETEKRIAEEAQFFVENKEKEGIITTESGLQYEVLTEGTGATPKPEDRVLAHYHGTLMDGTIFDSSVDRGQPTPFGVSQVIPGWVEGLQLMKVGAKYRFFIPQNLAYGMRPPTPKIPPGSALVFEVELIELNPEG